MDENVTDDIEVTAEFAEDVVYTLTYTSGENGALEGDSLQEVDEGENGTAVEAVPDDGYHFVEWSDGVTENPRVDENVTEDIEVAAEFAEDASEVEVQVYTRNEKMQSNRSSSPRLYIENTGEETLSDFSIYYNIITEDGKEPILEEYYVPQSDVSLISINDSLYSVEYDYSGVDLEPGEVIPNASGNSIGLHYSGWSEWDKSNDPSFCNSSEFVENTQVFVVSSEGDTIYGEAPASNMNRAAPRAAPDAEIRVAPTPATAEDEVVHIVIDADETVDNVKISVYNSVSEIVDQQSSSDVSDSYEFTWDLKNRNGDMVSSGNYVVIAELEFTNGTSKKIEKVFGIQK